MFFLAALIGAPLLYLSLRFFWAPALASIFCGLFAIGTHVARETYVTVRGIVIHRHQVARSVVFWAMLIGAWASAVIFFRIPF